MREVIVRFENAPGLEDDPGTVVRGSVSVAGRRATPPFRFDGWLQLLGLLEELSSMTDESPEPPRPLPSTDGS